MLFLKSCPRCGGDLVAERDEECGYLACVQCGHVLSQAQERALGARLTRRQAVCVHQMAAPAHALSRRDALPAEACAPVGA